MPAGRGIKKFRGFNELVKYARVDLQQKPGVVLAILKSKKAFRRRIKLNTVRFAANELLKLLAIGLKIHPTINEQIKIREQFTHRFSSGFD